MEQTLQYSIVETMITYFNCATASLQQCLLALDIIRPSVVISLSFLTFRKAENNYIQVLSLINCL